MGLSDLVNVSVTKSTSTPTRENFGTPLIAAYHSVFPDRVRTYTSLTAMVSDGFAVTHPAYLAASALKAQDPSPPSWKIGRRALAPTQTITLKCLSAAEGDKYHLEIGLPGGTLTAVDYTVPSSGSPTTTTVAAAIEALIEAVTGIDSTASTDTITVTATAGAGQLFDVQNWSANFELKNTTADPGIATDLAAILAVDSAWYGLTLDSNSKAELVAAAAWAESAKKLLVGTTSDTECGSNAVTNDVLSTLKGSSYAYTGVVFNGKKLLSYAGAAWQSGRLTATPGSDTWAFKTLKGVPVDDEKSLSASQEATVQTKNGNTYTAIAGLNVTFPGKSASGEFFDVTRFVDWVVSECKTRIFAMLANSPKVPFTDGGADKVRAVVQAVLSEGVQNGGFNPGDGGEIKAPSCTVPKVASVATVDRAARNLPGVKFQGTLAGAIHTLTVQGEIGV